MALISQANSEEKIFENGGRWTTDGRRLDGYTISSPYEPNGSGELMIRPYTQMSNEILSNE